MAVVMEFVIGGLTAVCASLIVVLLIWRLSRHFCFRSTPPCCDVTDLLAWLIDAFQAVMGAAILVLVVSADVTCAVAGFLAMFGGAQTLCLLATRAVVRATGHVDRGESRDVELRGRCVDNSKMNADRWSGALCIPLLVLQIAVVTVFCSLPLSELPVATTTVPRNHTAYHITCLPLTFESRDTAAWSYSCFLLVAVGWLPLLVAMTTDVIHYSRGICSAATRTECRSDFAAFLWSGALRMIVWTLVLALTSVELSTAPSPSAVAQVQLVLVFSVDVAMLLHVVHDVLYLRHHHHHQQQQQQQQQQLPARLTAVTRAHRQLVRSQ